MFLSDFTSHALSGIFFVSILVLFTHHVLSAGRTLSPTFVTRNTDIVPLSGFYTTEIAILLDLLTKIVSYYHICEAICFVI